MADRGKQELPNDTFRDRQLQVLMEFGSTDGENHKLANLASGPSGTAVPYYFQKIEQKP